MERGDATINNLIEDSYFMGYLLGVSDSLQRIVYCPDPTTTVRQLAATVSKYMDEHRSQWSAPADAIVRDAISNAFPCP